MHGSDVQMIEIGGQRGTVLLDLNDNSNKKVQANILAGLLKGAELGYNAVIGEQE